MWTSLACTPEITAPSSRTKHSATLLGNHVYLFGGRNGNLPLKDLWEYSLVDGRWTQLEPTGDRPPCLQEHSAVAYKDNIYVFGGEVGFSAGSETPLWIYNTKNNTWKKIKGQKSVLAPKGRRGHSALVYKGSMVIYGGYQDLRGSSNELWAFHFETETWHLLSPKSSSVSLQRPSGRHKHSAVLHDGAMWIYGGMTDLQERGDLWRWDIDSKLWFNIRTKTNPGALHSHAVCKLPSSMLIFGGESNGVLSNDMWRFHFGTESWEKLQFPGNKPHPRAESVALIVSGLVGRDKSEKSFSTEPSWACYSSVNPKINSQVLGNSGNHLKNVGNNKFGLIEKKYVFEECSSNLVSNVVHNNNLNFLKEISKLSSINLSRFNHKCSYSVLNSSHDSTESLLKAKESSDSENTPTRMVKSQSANLIVNSEKKKTTFSTLTPATEKLPYSIVESGEFTISESDKSSKSLMCRDPISVPNLNDFSSNSQSSVNMPNDKLLYLDSDEPDLGINNCKVNELDNVKINNIGKQSNKGINWDIDKNRINLPGTPLSEDVKGLEPKIKNSDNYNFSKRCQSDSYSSHLVMLGNEENSEWKDGIPKSASVVRFRKNLEEIADELTSDYCSIETVNKVSSSSNYSQSPGDTHKELLNDYPEFKFGKSTNPSVKKNNSKDFGYGFSNPNYLGPDVQTILKTKEVQNYAKILNSPPDSVLEDTDKSISKNLKENVEMRNISTNQSRQTEFKISKQTRSPPKYLPLRGNPYHSTTVPIAADKKKKPRASSVSRGGKQETHSSNAQRSINEELSKINLESLVPMSVFLIGGKEQGQITVFKRPISLWKLRLSSNVY